MCYLLTDEKSISESDYVVREKLCEEFKNLPGDFFSRMRHFQPQIGCFNNCGFCSKFSVCRSEYWDEATIRNVISAIKYSASNYTNGDLLLAWNRGEHRLGVNFPYLDNDIGSYLYLDKFIDLCYKELGVRNRISSVGYSRHNKRLNDMHKRICKHDLLALAGVRLSVSQYGRVWEDNDSNTNLEEYKKDIANFLSIYKDYYDSFGSGSRKMCVEIRYNPLVVNSDVIVTEYNGYMVLCVNNYLFISDNKNINFKESYVSDPYIHALKLSEEPIYFKEYNLPYEMDKNKLLDYLNSNYNSLDYVRDCEVYLFINQDGEYYAINPKINDNGNYGFNIYPKTDIRKKSGYIVTERFLLNAIYEFKNKFGLNLRDKYFNSNWDDVDSVLNICQDIAERYKRAGKLEKANYIEEHIIKLVRVYVDALKLAGYSSDCFFDSKFTIDTGMICNLGRAITLFKGLTNFVNEPLTPTHERNYGRYCSTMKQENYVWKLSCGFNNSIVIEKLDLFNTASRQGQTSFRKSIKFDNINKCLTDNVENFLYPGIIKE